MSGSDTFEGTHVTCAERQWWISGRSARDWVMAVAIDPDNLSQIMPGMLGDEDIEIMVGIARQYEDIASRWRQSARTVLGRASYREWWWTHNLIRMCLGGWKWINGRLIREGVYADRTSLPDWCDAAYSYLYDGSDEKGRMKLDMTLRMPPAGVSVKQSKAEMKAAVAAFAAD